MFVRTSSARNRWVARAGVSTELGEDPPVLQVGKAAFDGDASGGQDPVGLLLGGCEPAGAGGLEAGDNHGIVPVVVQAEQFPTAAGGTLVTPRSPCGPVTGGW